jgi:hypothetical protein
MDFCRSATFACGNKIEPLPEEDQSDRHKPPRDLKSRPIQSHTASLTESLSWMPPLTTMRPHRDTTETLHAPLPSAGSFSTRARRACLVARTPTHPAPAPPCSHAAAGRWRWLASSLPGAGLGAFSVPTSAAASILDRHLAGDLTRRPGSAICDGRFGRGGAQSRQHRGPSSC